MSATPIKVNPSRCASVLGTSAMLVAVNSTTVGVMGPSAVPRAAGHVAPGGSADTNGVLEAGYVSPHDEACHFVEDVVAVVTGVEDASSTQMPGRSRRCPSGSTRSCSASSSAASRR